MSRIRARNSKPELSVRRMLHRLGFRYRLHRKDLPGSPDIVFGRKRKIIFVHGCFWHRHEDPECPLARLPKSRLDFWLPKLEGNRKRDMEQHRELRRLGWQIFVVWECQLRQVEQVENSLVEFLR